MFDSSYHIPILLKEVIENLTHGFDLNSQFSVVDLTFGGGGHSIEFLRRFPNSKVIGFDQDQDAINHGKDYLIKLGFQDRVNLINKNFTSFSELKEILKKENVKAVLADIGVSSHQFDEASRGFSFKKDAPLDMRMNQNSELTAKKIVNEYSEENLEQIIRDYSEDKFSKRIAKAICEYRTNEGVIKTTTQLENIAFHCYPKTMRFSGIHPATRLFQALRIEVNQELKVLEILLNEIESMENKEFSLGIITFHSLEDRIVKHKFKDWSKSDNKCQLITKKAIKPTEHEILSNPRSRSAKLRVIKFGTAGSGYDKISKKEKWKHTQSPQEQ